MRGRPSGAQSELPVLDLSHKGLIWRIRLTGLRILAQLSVPAGNTVLKSQCCRSLLRVLTMKFAPDSHSLPGGSIGCPYRHRRMSAQEELLRWCGV
jgi:hypothetical protein